LHTSLTRGRKVFLSYFVSFLFLFFLFFHLINFFNYFFKKNNSQRKFEENEEHKLYFADDIQETPDLISDPHIEETKQE